MKHLVVGVSYRSAPMALLEQLAIPAAHMTEILDTLVDQSSVAEAVVLSTCNRTEVYAAAENESAASLVIEVLASYVGVTSAELSDRVYVHWDENAVAHTYRVASGLDSMIVGDAQILGQLRGAYKVAVSHGAAGSASHRLFQSALAVAKRVRAETDLDRVSGTLVSAALDFGSRRSGIEPAGASVLIIGAGTMGNLALATLHRAGAGRLTVANRTVERLDKVTDLYGAIPVPLTGLPEALRDADIVVSAASTQGFLLGPEILGDRPRLLIDLGLPRNIDPAVGELPGVSLVGIEELGAALAGASDIAAERVAATEATVGTARLIVNAEVADYVASSRVREVSPVLAALRARANDVVEAELRGFASKQPDLTEKAHAEVARTVHRVVQQLLHHPTVSVRKLAASPGGERYAALLREIFALEGVLPA